MKLKQIKHFENVAYKCDVFYEKGTYYHYLTFIVDGTAKQIPVHCSIMHSVLQKIRFCFCFQSSEMFRLQSCWLLVINKKYLIVCSFWLPVWLFSFSICGFVLATYWLHVCYIHHTYILQYV